jgi:ABC-2 type transport system permease protein
VSTRFAIAGVVAKPAVRSGILWGVIFGFCVATQALAYATSYKTAAARQLLVQEFGHDAGISALVGPATQINTVAGFVAWKCLTVLVIMGAVWGVLTSTKLTRGEEDLGRWEIMLAGPVTRRGAAREALEGLVLGWCGLFGVTAVILVGLGRSSKVHIGAGHSLFFAVAISAGAAMFLALGAFCAQLATSRRQGAGYASVILGASYALRMVADSGTGLTWLRWVSPLGWVEELQPLTHPSTLALVPITLFVVVCGAAAFYIAGRRDLGAGTLPDRSTSTRMDSLLTSTWGLGVYLSRSTVIAWSCGIVAYGLLLGSIAKSGGTLVTSTPEIRRVLSLLGISGVDAYLGVALLIMSILLSFVAVGQISAARKEESSGQLDNLLVRPVARVSWLVERVGLAAGVVILMGLLAGLSTWAGAVADHANVRLVSLLEAGLNVAVPALVLLGVGVFVFGLAPRMTTIASYAVFVWFTLIEIVSGIANINHWVLDTSAFHQMAPAPSVPANWTVNGVMAALAVVACVIGAVAFNRRDVIGE